MFEEIILLFETATRLTASFMGICNYTLWPPGLVCKASAVENDASKIESD